MVRTLNIRIVELITKEKRSSFNYLYALAYTKENMKQISKMKIVQNKGGNLLLCEKQVSFNIETQLNNHVYIELKRNRFLISDDQLGQIALPLEWFPSNHIVREWFPIKKNKEEPHIGMILLDIHIDCRGCSPFMAPFTSMKVNPSWKRPELTENSEVLPNPTIIYCTPNQPNYPPVGQQDQYQNAYDLPQNYCIPPHHQIIPPPYQLGNQQPYQIGHQLSPQMIPPSHQVTCQSPQLPMYGQQPYQIMQLNQQPNQQSLNDQNVCQQEPNCMQNQQVNCNHLQVFYPQLQSDQDFYQQNQNQSNDFPYQSYQSENKDDIN